MSSRIDCDQQLMNQAAFFDVPLHMNFHHASNHITRYDLRSVMNNSLAKVKPRDAVTFVDNHECVPQSVLTISDQLTISNWKHGQDFEPPARVVSHLYRLRDRA